MTAGNKQKFCLWCSKPMVDGVHTNERGEAFCCEGCYLGYMAHEYSQRERDEFQLLLVLVKQ